jgi:hypothetical protein
MEEGSVSVSLSLPRSSLARALHSPRFLKPGFDSTGQEYLGSEAETGRFSISEIPLAPR